MSHSISTLKCSTLKVWFVIFPHEIFSSISASKNGTNILPASQARTIIGILCCSPTAYIQSTIQPYSISTIFLNSSTFPHLNIHNLVFDIIISSGQFSPSVVSDSLQPHGLQHTRLPVYHQFSRTSRRFKFRSIMSMIPPNYLILCHPLLLLPSIFPSIRVFPMSQFFASHGQSPVN